VRSIEDVDRKLAHELFRLNVERRGAGGTLHAEPEKNSWPTRAGIEEKLGGARVQFLEALWTICREALVAGPMS